MPTALHFVFPGDLQTRTGGYGYDRALIASLESLGFTVQRHALSARFPAPDAEALAAAEACFAALPNDTPVIVDGLAYGVLDAVAERHGPRLRLVALCHHPLVLEAGLSGADAQRLQQTEQRALAAAQAVIVTSPATARLLTDQFAVPPSRITVALPGTPRPPFAPCNGNPPVLLTVATLTPRKGHDLLIQALARLAHLPWTLRLVGGAQFDPAWAQALREQVTACGLTDRVLFLGELAQLDAEYQAADVFVLPSRFEGYGMAFAEALSFGLPILATRAGAIPEVVPPTAGLLVPPDDVEALTEALLTLLTEPARRQALQHGAREAASRLPTWADCAQRVATLLQRLPSRHASTATDPGFSSAWLDLREPADRAARDAGLATQVLAWLRPTDSGRALIVDLGAGTGSTLRALTAGGADVDWRLVDHDPRLLAEAGRRHGAQPGVTLHPGDLRDPAALPLAGAHLVTASALFDLVSQPVLEALAQRIVALGEGFYAALNYDGSTHWQPSHPLDDAVLAAFNQDQRRDKGLGPALGPDSGAALAAVFIQRGYRVSTADSPWVLGPQDHALVRELIGGIADAVMHGHGLDPEAVQAWRAFRLAAAASGHCQVGHLDVLALPPT